MSSDSCTNRFSGRSGDSGSRARYIRRLTGTNSKWHKIRWALPILFVVGYLATYSNLEGFEIEYLVWTLFCIAACCLLLACLCPPVNKKLPIWIILTVFIVAFYSKFYWMAYNPEILGDDWVSLRIYHLAQSPTVLLKWFKTISYAFIIFCLTARVLLGNSKFSQNNRPKGNVDYKAAISILIWLIPILMGVTTYTMYIFGIARMAGDNQYLPFRLAGWMFHIRSTLIPALLLLLIWCSGQKGLQKYFTFGIILLFLHGASDMLLRSSRGALLRVFIMLFMLLCATNRITKKRVLLFAAVLLITIMLLPVMSSYRSPRASDMSTPISSLLVEAVRDVSGAESFSLFEIFKKGSIFMLFRFTGADSLLHIIGADPQPLYAEAITGSMNVTDYMTVDIIGFPEEAIMGYAPSALGWFYIVGGTVMVVIGTFGFVCFTWFCWRLLIKLRLLCMPVAQALLMIWLFTLFTEGTLDGLYFGILIMGGAIAACEWLLRISRRSMVLKDARSFKEKRQILA